MRHTKISLADTHAFSQFFLDYIQQKPSLTPFYDQFPSVENFNISLTKKEKSFTAESRKVLKESLTKQYGDLQLSSSVKSNIDSLTDSKTFTITTGHQLNIFTGPLYFIFKIVTVVNACKRLKEKYPEYKFVPVYWMASEDHDYDEIKYFRLYGKKYVWETKQKGAVGRFDTKEIKTLLDSIPGDVSVFRNAYTKYNKLSDAVRYYVNELFANEGVVVIDADDKSLKSRFTNVMQGDIIHNKTIELVSKTNEALEKSGYKGQVFCRDTNFFFLDNQLRSRIEKLAIDGQPTNQPKECKYQVVDTDISFSESQLKDLIKNEPEKFSPNVILRPLYQEMILPNLAYVGGPAEMVYWLQLKNVFDHYNIPFPILLPRNFGMIIDHTIDRKIKKTGLDVKDYFEDKNYLFNHWVIKNTHHNLTVGEERNQIQNIYTALKERAESVDKTLTAFVAAEGKRALNSLEKIEKKLLRAEKRLHTDKLRQIEEVKDLLFPSGSLQERTDNFLNFYQRDPAFIQKLIEHFDPFDYNFSVLTYTDNDQAGA